MSAPDATFARRDAYLREIARVLHPETGVYVVVPVCGVDVAALLTTGAAVRHDVAACGAARPPRDAFEAARAAPDGSDPQTFEILQIIASQQKHAFRCVPAGWATPAGGDDGADFDDDDDALDFDDAVIPGLTLRRGFFCGSCGGEVDELSGWPVAVPARCGRCGADARRFAMS